jgi:hypothetical protein
MGKVFLAVFIIVVFFSSCEREINLDLRKSDPVVVIEANIYKDSVATVHITKTTGYFSSDDPLPVESAIVKINDGNNNEELLSMGNGYYKGNVIKGITGKTYSVDVTCEDKTYTAISVMPEMAEIRSAISFRSESSGLLNPGGKPVFTITTQFTDEPDIKNYYLMSFISGGSLLERYYLITEEGANSGFVDYDTNGKITFSESIFFEGGVVSIQLFSVDEPVYNYFLQLSDILFWKRRIIPPTPYNPKSNFSNGSLGYFAAWAYDSKKIVLE